MAFVMIVFPKLSPISFILLGILLIIGGVQKHIQFRWTFSSTWFILLYLLYFVGVIFSNAPEWKELEYKLSWLILPLLLSFHPKQEWSLRMPALGVISGVVIATIYGFYSAYTCYAETGWLAYCFNGVFISPIHHPTYFTLMTLFATAIAWYGNHKEWKGFSPIMTIGMTLLTVIMTYFYFSFAGILYLLLLTAGLVAFWVKKKIGFRKTIVVALGLVALIISVVLVSDKLKQEVQSNMENVSSYLMQPDAFLNDRKDLEYIPGNEERLILWNITGQYIASHPLGVGSGKSVEVLKKELDQLGFKQLVENELNPHNQYLQTGLELGWIGLVALLSFFIAIGWYAFNNRLIVLLVLVSGFAFNGLFESMFQRQSGIVFFTFWVALLVLYHRSASEHKALGN